MVKKILTEILILLALVLVKTSITPVSVWAADDYQITDFQSQIILNQDTSLLVKETIKVNFLVAKHGIYRVIPVIYSAQGKTIKAGLTDVQVTDGQGTPIQVDRSRLAQSIKLRIGDPDRTLTGPMTYVISYRITDVIQRFEGYDEIYWNVTGSEWDTPIPLPKAQVESPFATIIKTSCFAGGFGTQQQFCTSQHQQNIAMFASSTSVGQGSDFTIVVALDSQNQLQFPGPVEQTMKLIIDNLGYGLALLPLLIISYLWYRRGRDFRYASDQIYYQPENVEQKLVSPFARPHLPMVYAPIQDLTPAQVGTIIDEKVDIHDLVAEIVELARLKYLEIHKLTAKKLLGTDVDYAFVKLEGSKSKLEPYQQYLLDKLFTDKRLEKSQKRFDKLAKDSQQQLEQVIKQRDKQSYVLLSALKDDFYKDLDKFRKQLYANMKDKNYFVGNPEKTRSQWLVIYVLIMAAMLGLVSFWTNLTANYWPLIVGAVVSAPGLILAAAMPRRTAWGYSLYRQISGLKYFIGKGKWRQQIAEKHLFLEETLPLAISLGVVDQLAKDMAKLGVEPPSYTQGFTAGALAADFSKFESQTGQVLTSSPSSSGRSSWSGGSGFSGGSSGGGFGGGGGGSW